MHLLFHPFCAVVLHFHNVSAFSWLHCCFHLRLSSTLLGSQGWWALGALFCRRGSWGWAVESLACARIRMKISWLKIQRPHRPSLGRINRYKAGGCIASFLRLHCVCPTPVVLTGLFTGSFPWENPLFPITLLCTFYLFTGHVMFLSLGFQVQLPAF